MSLQQDIEIYQGEAVLIPLTVYTDTAKTARKNLGGATIDYRIGSAALDTLTLRVTGVPNGNGSSTSVTDPLNGGALLTLGLADTAALRAKRYAHQVIVTDAAGKPNVVTDGYLNVRETLPSA